MPYFAHHKKSSSSEGTDGGGDDDDWLAKPLQDDVSSLQSDSVEIPQFKGPKQRRSFFSSVDKRKAITFGPEVRSDFYFYFRFAGGGRL
jgi:hypothetical protein